jgi:hypothetical protein
MELEEPQIAEVMEIINIDNATYAKAINYAGVLFKFSFCPLVFQGEIKPKVGNLVELSNLLPRPYGFKAEHAKLYT